MAKVIAMTVRSEVAERTNALKHKAHVAKVVAEARASLTDSPWKRISRLLQD